MAGIKRRYKMRQHVEVTVQYRGVCAHMCLRVRHKDLRVSQIFSLCRMW